MVCYWYSCTKRFKWYVHVYINLCTCVSVLLSLSIIYLKNFIDLFGLVYFLESRPHSIQPWWLELIWKPYHHGNPRPMIALFSNLMWRNSKTDVADEVSHDAHVRSFLIVGLLLLAMPPRIKGRDSLVDIQLS